MTLLDIILAIPLGIFIFLGWKRGVVREAATLVGVLVGIWAAVHFSRLIASLLGLTGDHAILIAFFILFVGTMVLAFLLGRIAERVLKSLKMNLPNKIAGAALGMVKALCILAVLLNWLGVPALAFSPFAITKPLAIFANRLKERIVFSMHLKYSMWSRSMLSISET